MVCHHVVWPRDETGETTRVRKAHSDTACCLELLWPADVTIAQTLMHLGHFRKGVDEQWFILEDIFLF